MPEEEFKERGEEYPRITIKIPELYRRSGSEFFEILEYSITRHFSQRIKYCDWVDDSKEFIQVKIDFFDGGHQLLEFEFEVLEKIVADYIKNPDSLPTEIEAILIADL